MKALITVGLLVIIALCLGITCHAQDIRKDTTNNYWYAPINSVSFLDKLVSRLYVAPIDLTDSASVLYTLYDESSNAVYRSVVPMNKSEYSSWNSNINEQIYQFVATKLHLTFK